MATGQLYPLATVTASPSTSAGYTVTGSVPTLVDFGAAISVDLSTIDQEHLNDGNSDDSYGMEIRIRTQDSSTVLAAADAGGAYHPISPLTNQPNAGSWTALATTATTFPYVNTAATEAQWKTARFEYSFIYSKTKADDIGQIRVLGGAASFVTLEYSQTVPADVLLADDIQCTGNTISVPTAGQANHALIKTDLSANSTVGVSPVGQVHTLVKVDLTSNTTLSEPTCTYVPISVPVLADDITTPANTITVPAIGQTHVQLATAIAALAELTVPTVGQAHSFGTADPLVALSELTTPSISATLEYALVANPLQSLSNLTAPSPGQLHGVLAIGVVSESNLGTAPGLTQAQGLGAAEGLEAFAQLALGVLQTENALGAAAYLEASAALSVPELLAFAGLDPLLADDLSAQAELGVAGGLTQAHSLTPTDLNSVSQVPIANWYQIHPFTPDSRSSNSSLSVPTVAETVGQTNLHPVMIGSIAEITDPTGFGQSHTVAPQPLSATSKIQQGQAIAQSHTLSPGPLEATTELSVPLAIETGLVFALSVEVNQLESTVEIGICECFNYNPVGESGVVNFSNIGLGNGNLQRPRAICASLHQQSYLSGADMEAVRKYIAELKALIGL